LAQSNEDPSLCVSGVSAESAIDRPKRHDQTPMISLAPRAGSVKIIFGSHRCVSAVIAAGFMLCGMASAQSLQNAFLRNSFNPVGAGARGIGMGGAFIAVADDGTAASFNPAGLTQLRRMELAAVMSGSSLTATVTDRTGGAPPWDDKVRHAVPDFIGLAMPFRFQGRHTTVQLSYQRIVDLFGRGAASASIEGPFSHLEIPPALEGMPQRYLMSIQGEQKGALHAAMVSAAYELTDQLSVGATMNFWIGNWWAAGERFGCLQIKVDTHQRPIEFPAGEHTFHQDHNLRGLSLNLGVLLRRSHISAGAVLRLPFRANYRLDEHGSGHFYNIARGRREPTIEESVRMNSALRWPRSSGVGLAYRPITGLTLAGDYIHTTWSQTVLENVPTGALLTEYAATATGTLVTGDFLDRNFFDLFPASQTMTKNSGQWRAGIEYLFALPRMILPVRIGVFQERSPIPDMATLDSRRINGQTMGFGVNFDRVVLDVAFERRAYSGAVGAALSNDLTTSQSTFASESVTHYRFVGSLIFRMGRIGSIRSKR
jgi:long-chain fatty acid transport protein